MASTQGQYAKVNASPADVSQADSPLGGTHTGLSPSMASVRDQSDRDHVHDSAHTIGDAIVAHEPAATPRADDPELEDVNQNPTLQNNVQPCTPAPQPSSDRETPVHIDDDHQNDTEAEKTFAEILLTYIPEDSDLCRSICERKPWAMMMPKRNQVRWTASLHDTTDWLRKRSKIPATTETGDAVLFVEDINLAWAQELHSIFSSSSRTSSSRLAAFLIEHMVHLGDDPMTEDSLARLHESLARYCQGTKMFVTPSAPKKSITFAFESLKSYTAPTHLDIEIRSLQEYQNDYGNNDYSGNDLLRFHRRGQILVQDSEGRWRRMSSRLSWYQLDPHLHLVLLGKGSAHDHSKISLQLRVDRGDRRQVHIPQLPYLTGYHPANLNMYAMMTRLLDDHSPQSVFDPDVRPDYDEDHSFEPGAWRRRNLVWLLIESTWQRKVAALSSELQRLRRRVTILTGEESFPLLTNFRREVAVFQMLMAESKEYCVETISDVDHWKVRGKRMDVDEFWDAKPLALTARTYGRARSMDIRHLPDSLEKLEEKLGVIMQTINEEIQVVIGSVQVEDAKTMKRQTEFTVVLAVLAAIYLPLTLVTGVFGMNIAEIGANAPSWRWVVGLWVIAVSMTISIILLYAAWRWRVWRSPLERFGTWYRKKSEESKREALDLEAQKRK